MSLINNYKPSKSQINKVADAQEEPLYRARLGHKGRGPKRILTEQGKKNFEKIKWNK